MEMKEDFLYILRIPLLGWRIDYARDCQPWELECVKPIRSLSCEKKVSLRMVQR